jgi:hypothetical protein
MRFLTLRAVFLIGFVVAMPVLALPPVARRVDDLLYGPLPNDSSHRPIVAPAVQSAHSPASQYTSGASAIEAKPAVVMEARLLQTAPAPGSTVNDNSPWPTAPSGAPQNSAAAREEPDPPPLTPLPSFAPLSAASRRTTEPEPEIDDRTVARLDQVRKRLEELGAEHVIAESLEGASRYRFRCRMFVDANSQLTHPFEAIAADPVAAAEQVVTQVEQWRAAANRAHSSAVR